MFRQILISAAVFASAAIFTPIAPAAQLTLAGTPCIDITGKNAPCTVTSSGITTVADPTFNLTNDPGSTNLGIFVVPGDVVLFENANGSLTNRLSWSDVLEFSDQPGVQGSTATIFPDAEGVGVILPAGFVLSGNAVGIQENPVGVGNDSDFTTYTAGSAVYMVHSDSPCCELPDPETPEPSTMALLGLGISGFWFLGRRKGR